MLSRVSVPLGEFRSIALQRALSDLAALERDGSEGFEKRELSPLLVRMPPREALQHIEGRAARLPPSRHVERIVKVSREIERARTALDALGAYYELVGLVDASSGPTFSADRLHVHVAVSGTGDYVSSISELFADARDHGRSLSGSEQAALDIADWRLRSTSPLSRPFACLGTSGFREIQTWLSLADPGPDHARITAATSNVLRGLVVHIEYIDRDMIDDKEVLEPYRLPAAWHAARVRLRIGDAVPCSAFIGRPIFENRLERGRVSDRTFEIDLLKTVHLHASACSTMFMSGIADCKIAIERMTSSAAIAFMRALAGNVFREIGRQTLSAAFNINTPIEIDEGGQIRLERDRYRIAQKGIELAVAGGFEKVTWDGASNEVPSKPIVEQLTHEELVDLVHLAHEHGLETYISAGMVAEHMANAVRAGVDGVGIGTSMHWIDARTKLMGALKADAIATALRVRDEAAASPLGKAAALLARADQMHFEGSLLDHEEPMRSALHVALRAGDEIEATRCSRDLERVTQLPEVPLSENPWVARGRRRLARAALDVDRSIGDVEGLADAVQAGDVATIQSLLHRGA